MPKILFNVGSRELSYRQTIINWISNHSGYRGQVVRESYTKENLAHKAIQLGTELVVVSNLDTIKAITPANHSSEDWHGAVIPINNILVLIIPPLARIHTSPTGQFLLNTYLNKIPELLSQGLFTYSYTVCTTEKLLKEAKELLARALIISADIETSRTNCITSIAFTPIMASGEIEETFVVNWGNYSLLPQTILTGQAILANNSYKCFHNGTFDAMHLLRFRSPPRNYLLDTEYLWHSWYSELKKSLSFVASLLLPDYYFWKKEAEKDPLGYNAKDSINTARILLKLFERMPRWAWMNYTRDYVLSIAPTVAVNLEGFLTDSKILETKKAEAEKDLSRLKADLIKMSGNPEFNPGSPQQIDTWLYKILKFNKPVQRAKKGKPPPKLATGEIQLKKLALDGPLQARIVTTLLSYRKEAKAFSTYYMAKLLDNRVYYSYNIDGTKTSRMSCSQSTLYANLGGDQYGSQIQNSPPYYKEALCADPGYILGNIDKSKSEAFCVANITGDKTLLEALNGDVDFYLYIINKFFNLGIWDKSDPIRDVGKKIVHATNYGMWVDTFIDTVGLTKMYEYRKMLGRDSMDIRLFAQYLLEVYHDYVDVKSWWNWTVRQVIINGFIDTPDGHRRIVFGDISRSTSLKKEIIAHQPQRLSVSAINRAFWKAFYKIQLPSEYRFRLKGQVHDSIVYQALKELFDRYTQQLKEIMEEPTYVKSFNKKHSAMMIIPVDIQSGSHWKEVKQ